MTDLEEFADVIGPDFPLERVRLLQSDTLAALSDWGAMLALKARLGLRSTATLAEVGDELVLIDDAEERLWSEELWLRCATRLIAWRRT